jgi:hypothetical protein
MLKPRIRCWEGIHDPVPQDSTEGLIEMCRDFIKSDMVGVEVGSFHGASSEVFSVFCSKLTCVDPWTLAQDQRGYQELPRDLSVLAEKNFDELMHQCKNIIKMRLFSDQAAPLFKDESLDFVYIDGAHDDINVELDIKLWSPKIKKGGYLSGHDYVIVKRIIDKLEIEVIKVYPDSSWISLR